MSEQDKELMPSGVFCCRTCGYTVLITRPWPKHRVCEGCDHQGTLVAVPPTMDGPRPLLSDAQPSEDRGGAPGAWLAESPWVPVGLLIVFVLGVLVFGGWVDEALRALLR